MVKHHWEKISPGKRRYIVLGIIIVLILGVLSVFTPSNDKSRVKQQENVIEHVLTDTNTRDLGVDAIAARLDTLTEKNEALRRDQERLKEKLSRDKGKRESDRLKEELRDLKKQLKEEERERTEALRDMRRSLKNNGPIEESDNRSAQDKPDPSKQSEKQRSGNQSSGVGDDLDAREVFDNPGSTQDSGSRRDRSSNNQSGRRSDDNKMEIVTVVDETKEEEAEDNADNASQYLATGSIVTGVIVAGMDAPTGQTARRDPFPALLRIKHDAILPNRFKQDVRECFVTASGYGDLSSERAYLRSEMISCVREDGGVIEKQLKAFATGEDGKAGVRGRLVSRQGQLIGRSMMAGFMQGVAGMFNVNPVPTVNTTDSDTQQYQRVLTSDALQGAAVKGTGQALERIAQFYIDMASDMYPVIEVDAGRRVDFIVQKGVSLDAK